MFYQHFKEIVQFQFFKCYFNIQLEEQLYTC